MRSLSVTLNSHWFNTTELSANATAPIALLLYENSNSSMSVLLKTAKRCPQVTKSTCVFDLDNPNKSWIDEWIDISRSKSNSTSSPGTALSGLLVNYTFSTPFTSMGGNEAYFSVGTVFIVDSTNPSWSNEIHSNPNLLYGNCQFLQNSDEGSSESGKHR